MDGLDLIREHFSKKKRFLEKQLLDVQKSRDASPSAAESHSDTSRSQLEKLAVALEEHIRNIEKFINLIPGSKIKSNKCELWSLVEIKIDENKMKLILVPDGMGGEKIGDFQLVSIASSLGETLLDKKPEEVGDFIGRKVTLLNLE